MHQENGEEGQAYDPALQDLGTYSSATWSLVCAGAGIACGWL